MRAILLPVVVCLAGACSFSPSGVDVDDAGIELVDADLGADARRLVDAAPEPDAPPEAFDADLGPTRCEPVPELVACYRFENRADRLRDESMYQNKGVATNATSEPGPPGEGNALGTGPGVSARVPDSASLDVPGDLTIELWIHIDSLPAGAGRAGLVDNNGQYGIFLGPGGELRTSIAGAQLIAGALVVGAWTHVAVTHETGKNTIYLDGLPVAEIGSAGNPATTGIDGLALGQDSPSGDNLDGALDTVKIWKKRRTPAEICRAARRSDCP